MFLAATGEWISTVGYLKGYLLLLPKRWWSHSYIPHPAGFCSKHSDQPWHVGGVPEANVSAGTHVVIFNVLKDAVSGFRSSSFVIVTYQLLIINLKKFVSETLLHVFTQFLCMWVWVGFLSQAVCFIWIYEKKARLSSSQLHKCVFSLPASRSLTDNTLYVKQQEHLLCMPTCCRQPCLLCSVQAGLRRAVSPALFCMHLPT